MGFEPIVPPPCIGYEGHPEFAGFLHFFQHDAFHHFLFFRIDGEVEFVVYLQDEFRTEVGVFEAAVYAYHGHLDDVGSRALYGGVDGIALGKGAHGVVAAVGAVGRVPGACHAAGLYPEQAMPGGLAGGDR